MNSTLETLEHSIASSNNIHHTDLTKAVSPTERHVTLYFISLTALSLLGYIYVFIFPLITLYIASVLPRLIISTSSYIDVVYIIVAISIASFSGWMSFQVFKIRPHKPSGRPLSPDETPRLIKLINEIQKEHKTGKIHEIKITDKFEIKIIRTSIYGYPVLFTNTLLIGLPLLQCLSNEQFKIALIRELSHLRKRFFRITSWFYFLRQYWCQYKLAYQNSWKIPHAIMRIFFSWYAPVYNILSQGAARKEKLYTDIYTLGSVDKVTLVEMISIIGISQHYLENNFWPHLYNKAYKHKAPPYLPYASIEQNIKSRIDNKISQTWIDQAMNSKQPPSDEPGFHQRLTNLDLQRVLLPHPVMQSACRFYLQDTLDTITHQMDTVWFMTHKFEWQNKYKTGQQEQRELKELGSQILSGFISDENAWIYIQLVKKYMEPADQIPLFKNLLKIHTEDARIRFHIGKTLLKNSDSTGLAALESAMEQDPNYTVVACQLITKYCVSTGDSKSAQAFRRKALAYQVDAA